MKNVLIASLALLLLAFTAPLLITRPVQDAAGAVQGSVAQTAPSPSATAASNVSADGAMIKLSRGGKVIDISLADYLVGTVAAEMPASFNIEALKAQAVAARTYAIHYIRDAKHSGFDVCDDPGCCCAYTDADALREKWGASFSLYFEKIKSAVEGTDGLYLTWEGEPIIAAFHSSSYGSTESSENVWSSEVPYLKSVKTPETSETVKNLFSTVTVSDKDFKDTVSKKYPKAVFGSDPANWISSLLYDESGRVSSIVVGGVKMTGAQFRQLFGLRSAAFSFTVGNGSIVFSVSGYGHGVGMSQYGANIMAGGGSTYDAILTAYYTGVQITKLTGNIRS